jgi:hypothetical protein
MILRIAVWTCVFYIAINGLLELAIRLKRPGILGFTLQGSVVLFGLAWLVSYYSLGNWSRGASCPTIVSFL